MDKKTSTNIAFIILILLLVYGASDAKKTPIQLSKLFDFPAIENKISSEDKQEERVVLKDFEQVPQPRRNVDKSIDINTAINYIETRFLNGTEVLELSKIENLSPYLNKKVIIIYVSKSSDQDVRAFIKDFVKMREKYKANPNLVFIPLETLWDLQDDSINNTHDRVINKLKKDCGLFCVLEVGRLNTMITLKGKSVGKKSSGIVEAVLKYITK